MEKVSYLGLKNCYRMANEHAEIIVSTDLGPRVLRYGFPGGENLLGEFPDSKSETEYGIWRSFAGHRLWAAPEAKPFSYAPDSDPIEHRIEGNMSIRLLQPTDAAGIDKEMAVSLAADSSQVEVFHRLTNRRTTPLEVAPWALTVFRGGTAIVPLEPFRSHDDALLPAQPFILWPFTDLGDPRFQFGNGFIRVKSDPKVIDPQKIGIANKRGWAAYHRGNALFVKNFPFVEGAKYPDYGSNNEVYVSGEYVEVETLAPLVRLQPGESVSHIERWRLFPAESETEISATLAQLASAIG